jgi:8-oxo-dGTP pyrophosphatase MutT (NUDIX family)
MEPCDHKSVGVLIVNPNEEVLVIERARPPLFWAPPAGHIDGHGDELAAAIEETSEEVGIGLCIEGLERVANGERMTNNQCRRSADGWHDWTVFATRVEDAEVVASPAEVKRFAWVSRAILCEMAYDPSASRQLEPVWTNILEKIGWLNRL